MVCLFAQLYACMNLSIYIFVCWWVFVCWCQIMDVCLHACLRRQCMNVYKRLPVCVCIHTCLCVCVNTPACVCAYTHLPVCVRVCPYVCVCVCWNHGCMREGEGAKAQHLVRKHARKYMHECVHIRACVGMASIFSHVVLPLHLLTLPLPFLLSLSLLPSLPSSVSSFLAFCLYSSPPPWPERFGICTHTRFLAINIFLFLIKPDLLSFRQFSFALFLSLALSFSCSISLFHSLCRSLTFHILSFSASSFLRDLFHVQSLCSDVFVYILTFKHFLSLTHVAPTTLFLPSIFLFPRSISLLYSFTLRPRSRSCTRSAKDYLSCQSLFFHLLSFLASRSSQSLSRALFLALSLSFNLSAFLCLGLWNRSIFSIHAFWIGFWLNFSLFRLIFLFRSIWFSLTLRTPPLFPYICSAKDFLAPSILLFFAQSLSLILSTFLWLFNLSLFPIHAAYGTFFLTQSLSHLLNLFFWSFLSFSDSSSPFFLLHTQHIWHYFLQNLSLSFFLSFSTSFNPLSLLNRSTALSLFLLNHFFSVSVPFSDSLNPLSLFNPFTALSFFAR